jgi:hypothetical protein
MSYKNDSLLVILNKYGKAAGIAKNELYETYDRIRDLTVSGPSISGSGLGKFSSFLLNIARTFGATSFSPTLGSEAVNIPGTSYYGPITGGSGIIPGGQAAFGLAPFSQYTGFPTGGAAPIGYAPTPATSSLGGPLGWFSARGIGALNGAGQRMSKFLGLGDQEYPTQDSIGGFAVGGASPVTATTTAGALSSAGGAIAGTAAGAGFGRNFVMPAASLMSAVGGLLTTLGPFFGPMGLAGVAAGSVLNGIGGAVLSSYQHVSNRIIANADIVLTDKVKNLESTIKMLDAQQDIIKKLLKESLDGDKKALDNI